MTALTVLLGVAPGLYAMAQADPTTLLVLSKVAWVLAACAWLDRYLTRHAYPRPLDLLMFSFGGGSLLLAYYVFRIRGRRAWRPLLAFVGLWMASWLAGSVLLVLAH